MIDRNVEFPSRYHITKVDGTDDVYELTPAPGTVSAEGTPINKATLLTDTTAMLYGLDNTAVPDNVFALLAGLLTSRVQMQVGSYSGDGKYGSSNPCTLTFDFKPMLVFVSASEGNFALAWDTIPATMLAIRGMTAFYTYRNTNGDSDTAKFTWGDDTLSWYATEQYHQLNDSGKTYYYCALGVPA